MRMDLETIGICTCYGILKICHSLVVFSSLSALSFPFNAVAQIQTSCSVFRKAEGDIIDESRKLGKNLNTSR